MQRYVEEEKFYPGIVDREIEQFVFCELRSACSANCANKRNFGRELWTFEQLCCKVWKTRKFIF